MKTLACCFTSVCLALSSSSATFAGVVVNEALTHADSPLTDAIELHNLAGAPADVSGWFLTDDPAVPKKYRIANGTIIPPGGYRVFDETQFNNSFTLSSSGGSVYVFAGDANANLTGYSHGFAFGAAASGVSFGRYVTSAGEEQFVAQASRTLGFVNSGPLEQNGSGSSITGVVVNEALTHADSPLLDAIELHNLTGAPADVSGWFLTDDLAVPKKYRIANGTTISPGGYLVFDETQFNNSFTLSSSGGAIYIFAGDANTNLTGYSHGFAFGAAANGVSFGRYVTSTGEEQFVAQASRTLGFANSGPLVGPLVIREIMYHPPDLSGGGDNRLDEYIEIYNITGAPVPLYDLAYPTNRWRIRGGVSFDFPADAIVGPNSSVVLVSFDLFNQVLFAAFRNRYSHFQSVQVFGPYFGNLDNSAGDVQIQRPAAPDAGGAPFILVDNVEYRDTAPWPLLADGSAASLRRIHLSQFGNDPINWIDSAPLSIVTPPQSFIVKVGTNAATATNVTFSVDAVGTSSLIYQWRRNGVNISGATNDSLTIVDAQLDDEGAYAVRVSDAQRSLVSVPGYLYVLGAWQPNIGSIGQAGDNVRIRFGVKVAHVVGVDYSDSLLPGSWLSLTNVVGPPIGSLDQIQASVFDQISTNSARFYRLRVVEEQQ